MIAEEGVAIISRGHCHGGKQVFSVYIAYYYIGVNRNRSVRLL